MSEVDQLIKDWMQSVSQEEAKILTDTAVGILEGHWLQTKTHQVHRTIFLQGETQGSIDFDNFAKLFLGLHSPNNWAKMLKHHPPLGEVDNESMGALIHSGNEKFVYPWLYYFATATFFGSESTGTISQLSSSLETDLQNLEASAVVWGNSVGIFDQMVGQTPGIIQSTDQLRERLKAVLNPLSGIFHGYFSGPTLLQTSPQFGITKIKLAALRELVGEDGSWKKILTHLLTDQNV